MQINPFPIRLKQARTKAGISQKELGIRLGMDESSVSSRINHYEKGRHMPDIQTIRQMAEELDVPMAYFFCDTEKIAGILCLIEKMPKDAVDKLLVQLQESN